MPKSLAIAGQMRPTQLVGGVASHFQNLCRGIEQLINLDPRFQDLTVDVYHGPAGTPYRSPRFAYHEKSQRWGRFAADARLGLFDSRRFDAALFPNYFRPPIVRSKRSVVVIHDLLDKHFPELSFWSRRAWLDVARRYALRRCDRVITISHAVRDDVLRAYGDRYAAKVTPIWNPIAFERLDGGAEQTITGGRPYVLGVAVDRPFKNLYTLIRSFAKLRKKRPDYCLVLVGELRARRPRSRIHAANVSQSMPSTVDLVRELDLDRDVRITGFVSDEELGSLYRGASAFVLPSLFEGFGMPPIEALALGAPTIVSGIASLREVTFGAAQYLDEPENIDAVTDVIDAVLNDVDSHRPSPDLVARIRRTFAPATIAAQYLEALFGLPPATSVPPQPGPASRLSALAAK